MNILVVDDEAIMIDSLRIALEDHGHRVFGTQTVEAALNFLDRKEADIDLILTDYLMPGLTGLDLLHRVRKSVSICPVILMTAFSEKELVIRALKGRCESFIEKPFSPDELIAEIERVHRERRHNDAPQKDSIDADTLSQIVHQINNPLLAISGYATMIAQTERPTGKIKEHTQKILDAVDRISRLNKEIIHAGKRKTQKKEIDIEALLNECMAMFQGVLHSKGIQVEKKIALNGETVFGNPTEIEHAIQNLVANAIDAMEESVIKILTISAKAVPEETAIEIQVEDTGCGIDEKALPHIFDPYFTQKRKGNGLGLAVAKQAVDSNQGQIRVVSQAGKGTTFTIRLKSALSPFPFAVDNGQFFRPIFMDGGGAPRHEHGS